MQILLGTHETIVRINSKSISIDYIQHFISTHFKSRTIQNNTIKIPASKENTYHRTFLLKWIYSLYSKKNGSLPELKESLLKRYYKSIKIVLPKKIVHTLKYKIINNETIQLSITPQNSTIAYAVKTFLQVKINILPTYLQITLPLKEDKERLKAFLALNNIINVPHKHIYNKIEMDKFLNEFKQKKVVKQTTPIDNAYIVLGVTPNDDIRSIKKQYRHLAKKLHPDTTLTEDKKLIELHTKKFQELLEAYEIVLNTKK